MMRQEGASSPALGNWTDDGEQKAGLVSRSDLRIIYRTRFGRRRLGLTCRFDLDPRVCHAPLQESESTSARLAPEGKNVEETC